MGASTDGTDVLTELRTGGRESLDRLLPRVYQELRAIAHRRLVGRDRGRTLSTTALVHEAYLKLVDRARARVALKRGGEGKRLTLDEEEIGVDDQPRVLLELNESLDHLAQVEPRLARVVECRFFGGLTEEEIAEALGVTVRTVERDWAKARMLLRRALSS